eukprot:symbB.v1.2.030778.t1/scaffold3506.1/size55141/1
MWSSPYVHSFQHRDEWATARFCQAITVGEINSDGGHCTGSEDSFPGKFQHLICQPRLRCTIFNQTGRVQVSLLRDGDGKHFPQRSVTAHLVGRLPNGCIFESTEGKGGSPMEMQLQKGAELTLGSIAEIRIPSELAYGKKGIPRIVPADCELIFEVHILEADGIQCAKELCERLAPAAFSANGDAVCHPWWLARVELLAPPLYYLNFCTQTAKGRTPVLLEKARSVARRSSHDLKNFDVGTADEPFIITDVQREWRAHGLWNLQWFKDHLGQKRQLLKWLGPVFTRQECLWEAPVYETTVQEYIDYMQELEKKDPDCEEQNAAQCPRLYLNGWPAFAQLPWLRGYVLPDGARSPADSMQGSIEDLNSLLIRESEALRESLLEGLTARGSYQPPDKEEQTQKLENEDWDLTKIFMSPKGAITRLHYDNGGAHAWLSQIQGRKMFVCFAPSAGMPTLSGHRRTTHHKQWQGTTVTNGCGVSSLSMKRLASRLLRSQQVRPLLLAGVTFSATRHRLRCESELEEEKLRLEQRAALVRSIQLGDVTTVLGNLDDVDAPLTSLGQTALHMACASGALPLVSALLKAGADPNICDRTGASCVAMASSAGHAHVLQKLLEHKAIKVPTYDVAGLTPVHKAVGFGQPDQDMFCYVFLDFLEGEATLPAEYGAAPSRYETALHIAARLLTRAINSPDGAGSSERQQRQQRELMRILLNFGADATAQDVNGDTPLHYSARTGDAWGFCLLLQSVDDPKTALLTSNVSGEDDGEHLHPFEGDEGLLNGSWLDPMDPDVFEKWP